MQDKGQTNMPTGDTHVQETTSEQREPEGNELRSTVANIETEQEQVRNENIEGDGTGQRETFRGMFESAEKLPETPAARMSAAFDELETLMEDVVSRRLSLPAISLPNISSTPTVTPTEVHRATRHRRTRSDESHSPISRAVSRVDEPVSALPEEQELGGSFIVTG